MRGVVSLAAAMAIPLTLADGTAFPPVSYTHLRAHETVLDLVCRLLLEKKKHQIPQAYTLCLILIYLLQLIQNYVLRLLP